MKTHQRFYALVRELLKIFVISLVLLMGVNTLQAQSVNMDKYITLTVIPNEEISLAFKAETDNTPIKIVSGIQEYDVNVGNTWTNAHNYLAQGSTMTIYGNLSGFDCNSNFGKLTACNPSHNKSLIELDCSWNYITNLNVQNNTVLEVLNCNANPLPSVNVENNTALTELYCGYTLITTLDVSANLLLKALYCGLNRLTSLDVSANEALIKLYCGSNKLTSLDVSNNMALQELKCKDNLLKTLDVTLNQELIWLDCSNNEILTWLNVANGNNHNFLKMNAFLCESLACIQIDNNFIPPGNCLLTSNTWTKEASTAWSTDCSGCNEINTNKRIILDINSLNDIKLDLKAEADSTPIRVLTGWEAYYIRLDTAWTTFEYEEPIGPITIYGKISGLSCSNNGFSVTGCDAQNQMHLKELDLAVNIHLTNLNVNGCTALTKLNCGWNELTTLDLSSCINLEELWCYENQLTTLNLSSNSLLTKINCSKNQLTNLDVSHCTHLTDLNCWWNQITQLDVSANTALTNLQCERNQLNTLDLSTNTALTHLDCANNQLTDLNVSANTVLTSLNCADNQLTHLDVGTNTALTGLNCADNRLNRLNVANGNNSNLEYMFANINPELECIQHDEGFFPETHSNWKKDEMAEWSVHCSEDIEEASLVSKNIQMYPNPVHHQVLVQTTGSVTLQRVEIYNTQGKQVVSTAQNIISLAGLQKGMYFVRIITTDGKIVYKKLMKE